MQLNDKQKPQNVTCEAPIYVDEYHLYLQLNRKKKHTVPKTEENQKNKNEQNFKIDSN